MAVAEAGAGDAKTNAATTKNALNMLAAPLSAADIARIERTAILCWHLSGGSIGRTEAGTQTTPRPARILEDWNPTYRAWAYVRSLVPRKDDPPCATQDGVSASGFYDTADADGAPYDANDILNASHNERHACEREQYAQLFDTRHGVVSYAVTCAAALATATQQQATRGAVTPKGKTPTPPPTADDVKKQAVAYAQAAMKHHRQQQQAAAATTGGTVAAANKDAGVLRGIPYSAQASCSALEWWCDRYGIAWDMSDTDSSQSLWDIFRRRGERMGWVYHGRDPDIGTGECMFGARRASAAQRGGISEPVLNRKVWAAHAAQCWELLQVFLSSGSDIHGLWHAAADTKQALSAAAGVPPQPTAVAHAQHTPPLLRAVAKPYPFLALALLEHAPTVWAAPGDKGPLRAVRPGTTHALDVTHMVYGRTILHYAVPDSAALWDRFMQCAPAELLNARGPAPPLPPAAVAAWRAQSGADGRDPPEIPTPFYTQVLNAYDDGEKLNALRALWTRADELDIVWRNPWNSRTALCEVFLRTGEQPSERSALVQLMRKGKSELQQLVRDRQPLVHRCLTLSSAAPPPAKTIEYYMAYVKKHPAVEAAENAPAPASAQLPKDCVALVDEYLAVHPLILTDGQVPVDEGFADIFG